VQYRKINNKLTSWSRALLEKLTVTQLGKTFSAFYGTRRFITVFTRSCHWSLPESDGKRKVFEAEDFLCNY
jgi:hypothetical protein